MTTVKHSSWIKIKRKVITQFYVCLLQSKSNGVSLILIKRYSCLKITINRTKCMTAPNCTMKFFFQVQLWNKQFMLHHVAEWFAEWFVWLKICTFTHKMNEDYVDCIHWTWIFALSDLPQKTNVPSETVIFVCLFSKHKKMTKCTQTAKITWQQNSIKTWCKTKKLNPYTIFLSQNIVVQM